MNTNFSTRQDYREALLFMLEPLKKYYSPGKAFVQVGCSGAPYGEKTAGLEGVSRILWGLVPLWMSGEESCLDEFVVEGIRNGANPEHEEYWGEYHGCHQAFVGEEAMPWGVIKGIVNRHFRWWFSKPILDLEGKLTLGYAYPNLTMCEGYNSPNSPYWAFKSFLVLALLKDHPFWTQKEEPLPPLDSCRLLPHAGMLIQRGEDGSVTALTSGQYADWEPSFTAEKYEKFAYSSYFGFQTARGYNQLHLAAPDNMLAFLRDGLYHVRRKCDKVVCREDAIESVWSPMEGVTVETQIKPCGKGHVRKHTIHAQSPCTAVEGGFPLPVHDPEEIAEEKDDTKIVISGTYGSSQIKLLEGEGKAGWLMCEPNVNVLHPRSVIPYFSYEIPQGTTEICVYVEGIPV